MSVIAWDGKTLAADKRASVHGLPVTVTKIFKVPQGIMGFCGNLSQGMELLNWFTDDKCNPDKYPTFQTLDEYCHVVLIRPKGIIHVYEKTPYPYIIEDEQYACGSGRDFALTAMHLGKNSHDAVLIACQFDINCGNGVDTLQLRK